MTVKKKMATVFITKQSFDYYKSCGFFESARTLFDLEIMKPASFETHIKNSVEKKLPHLDFIGWIDLLKYTKEKSYLRYNDKRFKNKNHHLYSQFKNANNIRILVKNKLINLLSHLFASKKGILFLEKILSRRVKKTKFYSELLEHYKMSKPDFIYISHQSSSYTLGLSIVAQKLNIPIICFIYSWDNVAKGNKLVNASYYFVWSEYMKNQLLDYYEEEVSKERIIVVGTPQFYHYTQEDFGIDKSLFFERYKIPQKDYYICFSGNFTAIGQDEPTYLKDLAEEVQIFNDKNEKQTHILLRANPVDYNDGFITVVSRFSKNITELSTPWTSTEKFGSLGKDKIALSILKATIAYSHAVVNIGSTMALDATISSKLAYYINYKIPKGAKKFNTEQIYKFPHFDSLKEGEPVKHIRHKKQFSIIFEDLQKENSKQLECQKKWAEKIVAHPLDQVANRMLKGFQKITKECM